MNRENLQKAADYIRTIPQEKFNMEFVRYAEEDFEHECKTVGCVLGHCPILFPWDKIPKHDCGAINYRDFVDDFFGIDLSANDDIFCWCFGGPWHVKDNSPLGAALRIEWLLQKGLPKNWHEQLFGDAPLCYYEGGKP